MKNFADAMIDLNTIIAEISIATSISSNVPSALDRIYYAGDKILVFREQEK